MILRPYQQESVDKTFEYLQSKKLNPLIALPTGTGKSLVIAAIVKEACRQWVHTRILVVTHVKELIAQNYEKLMALWPQAPAGIYSAGLGKRDIHCQIVYAGIDSLKDKGSNLGHRDLVLIDEAHRINMSGNTLYRKLFTDLYLINKRVKFIGLTATPYRKKQGLLTNKPGLFQDIVVDYTDLEGFNSLLDAGYLCPLVPRPANTFLDTTGVGSSGEDFIMKQLQEAVDKDEITYAALRECLELASECKSWMVFTTGVKHTENVAGMLDSLGVPSTFVHSKMAAGERDQRLVDFKSGHYRAIVNNNILTTGFDHPELDCIVCLRPTKSTSLWVQMLGRGTRIFPGKTACLVLDFARNSETLGPVNDPVIPDPNKKKKKGAGAPFRICPDCNTYNHAKAAFCCNPDCDHEFVYEDKFEAKAGETELIAKEKRKKKEKKPQELPEVVELDIDRVTYDNANPWYSSKPPHLKVVYHVGLRQFTTPICLEHEGYAGKKARDWWREHTGPDVVPPSTVREAMDLVETLKVPRKVVVWINRKNPEVQGVQF